MKAADKTWKGVDPRRVRDSWNRTNADFLTLFATLQTRAAADAMDSSTLMLAEQSDYIQPDGGIANPLAFGTGFAPSGIDLESYFGIPVTHTLSAIKSGMDESDAMQAGRATLRQMAMQAIEDTSISAMGVSITQRAGVGYVRVESPDCAHDAPSSPENTSGTTTTSSDTRNATAAPSPAKARKRPRNKAGSPVRWTASTI